MFSNVFFLYIIIFVFFCNFCSMQAGADGTIPVYLNVVHYTAVFFLLVN